jgi:hypothetical protein
VREAPEDRFYPLLSQNPPGRMDEHRGFGCMCGCDMDDGRMNREWVFGGCVMAKVGFMLAGWMCGG